MQTLARKTLDLPLNSETSFDSRLDCKIPPHEILHINLSIPHHFRGLYAFLFVHEQSRSVCGNKRYIVM
jgi:hypothetical protein